MKKTAEKTFTTEQLDQHKRVELEYEELLKTYDQQSKKYEQYNFNEEHGISNGDSERPVRPTLLLPEDIPQFSNSPEEIQNFLRWAKDVYKEYCFYIPAKCTVSTDLKVEFTENPVGLHVKAFISLIFKALRDLSVGHSQLFERKRRNGNAYFEGVEDDGEDDGINFGKLIRGFPDINFLQKQYNATKIDEITKIPKYINPNCLHVENPNAYFTFGEENMPRYLLCFEPCIKEPGYLSNGMYMWVLILDPVFCFEEYIMDIIVQYQKECDSKQRKKISESVVYSNINTDNSNELWKLFISSQFYKTTCEIMSPNYKPTMRSAPFEWPMTDFVRQDVTGVHFKPYSLSDVFKPSNIFKNKPNHINSKMSLEGEIFNNNNQNVSSVFLRRSVFHSILCWMSHSDLLTNTRDDVLAKLPYKINQETWNLICFYYLKKNLPTLKVDFAKDILPKQYVQNYDKKACDLVYSRCYFTMWNLIVKRTLCQWDFVSGMVLDTLKDMKKRYQISSEKITEFQTNRGAENFESLQEEVEIGQMILYKRENIILQDLDLEKQARMTTNEKENIKKKLLKSFLKRCPEEIQPYVEGKVGNVNNLEYERWGEQLKNQKYFYHYHILPMFENVNDLSNQILLWFHHCITDLINTSIGTRQELRWSFFLYLLSSATILDNGHCSALFYGANPGIGKREALMKLNTLLNSCRNSLYTILQGMSPGFWNTDDSLSATIFDEIKDNFFGQNDSSEKDASADNSKTPPMKEILAAGYGIAIQILMNPTTNMKKIVNYLKIFGPFIFLCNTPLSKHGDSALRSRLMELVFGLIIKLKNPDFENSPEMMQMIQSMFTVHAYYTKIDRILELGKQKNYVEINQILDSFVDLMNKHYGVEIHDRIREQYLDLYYFLNAAVSTSIALFTVYGHAKIKEPTLFNEEIFYLIDEINCIPRPQLLLFILSLLAGQYLSEVDEIILNFFREKYQQWNHDKTSEYLAQIYYNITNPDAPPNATFQEAKIRVLDTRYFTLKISDEQNFIKWMAKNFKLDEVSTRSAWDNLFKNSKYSSVVEITHNNLTVDKTIDNTCLKHSTTPQHMTVHALKRIEGQHKTTLIISAFELMKPLNNAHSEQFTKNILPFILPCSLDECPIVLPISIVFNGITIRKHYSIGSYDSQIPVKVILKKRKIDSFEELKLRNSYKYLKENPIDISLQTLKDIYNGDQRKYYRFENFTKGKYPEDIIKENIENKEREYTQPQLIFLENNIQYFLKASNVHYDITTYKIKFSNFQDILFKALMRVRCEDSEMEEIFGNIDKLRDHRTMIDDAFLDIYLVIESLKEFREKTILTLANWNAHAANVIHCNMSKLTHCLNYLRDAVTNYVKAAEKIFSAVNLYALNLSLLNPIMSFDRETCRDITSYLCFVLENTQYSFKADLSKFSMLEKEYREKKLQRFTEQSFSDSKGPSELVEFIRNFKN